MSEPHLLTLNEYQIGACRTAPIGQDANIKLAVFGLGIAGEAGEVADYIKKVVGHGHPLDRAKLQKELGDVLWYVAVLAAECGIELGQVAAVNEQKLRARYPAGFSTQASLERKDVDGEPPPQD